MPSAFKVKPTHKAVKSYYAALATYVDQSVEHEGALCSAFQNLLSETGRKVGWTLIPQLSLDANGHSIRPDGTFRDEFTIERGYWEAKDTDDDLKAEIKKKIKRGYRLTNTIFEDTREGRLYQDGKLDMIADLRDPQQLCDLLNAFFSHAEPAHDDFSKAVDEFKELRQPGKDEWSRGCTAILDTPFEHSLEKGERHEDGDWLARSEEAYAVAGQGGRRRRILAVPDCEAHYDHARSDLGME